MQKQKIRGMVLAAVVCCVSLSGCGAVTSIDYLFSLSAFMLR